MSEPDGLSTADLLLLADLSRGNDWTRALLCTLARRGTWLRRTDSARALALLDALSSWPVFKAGQFLFDLLEWEDFMVSEQPPEPLHRALDELAIARITRSLLSVVAHFDGARADDADISDATPAGKPVTPPATATTEPGLPAATDLPPLEPGFHLYRDVVLGVFLSVQAARAAAGEA